MRNVKSLVSQITLLSFFILFFHLNSFSQSSANYTFATNTTGSLIQDANSNSIDMSTGTTGLITTTSSDQSASAVTSIGFNFIFMGNIYTQFSASSNGIIQLGSSAVSSSNYVASGGTVSSPKISAFGADLGTGTTGSVKSKLVGTAPNRCLVIEFKNMTLLWTSSYTNDGTYQARFYENGVIEFVYGSMSITSTASATDNTVSIGFSTNTTANSFAYITTSSNTATTSGSFTDNPVYPSGNITNLHSTADGSRRVYTFTPPTAPAAPTWGTPTSITTTGMTLNWTDNATDELGYIILKSTDNVNFTQQGSLLAANTITSIITGLAPGTTFYWKILAIKEGSGSEASGSETTLAGATYYWVGSSGSTWSTAANWNTAADGTGSTRSLVLTTDVLIVDGAGTTAGAATTISVDLASFSIGQFKVTSNTACTLQSSITTTRTITITGGGGTDFLIESGCTLNLTNSTNPIVFVFSGSGNIGDIYGTLNFGGSTSNGLTTTGGTGTLVTVYGTGIVNLGAAGNTLVGSVATLSFLDGSNCNSTGATTTAPPVPLATWATNSNLTITGITSSTSSPTYNNQSFGNFTYNCPLASATMSFWTTSTTAVIKGNLTITAGATGGTGIFRALTSGTLTVNGNVVVNQGRFQSASSTGTLIVLGNTTNNANGIIDILAGTYSQRGSNFTNDGTLTGVASTSTLQFYSPTNVAQTLAGSGTVLTNLGVISVQNSGGLTISHVNQIPTLRVNLIAGTITGSGKITMGTGAALPVTTQIGITGLTTPGGSFDVSPAYNLGTGSYTVTYQQESVNRTTGFEIPSSRIVSNVILNNTNGVTLAGGDLTIGTSAAAGLLTLTAGILDAGSSSVILPFTGTSISGGSATSYVNGKLLRSFAASRTASGTYTSATFFPIGKGGSYMPIYIDPTTTSGGSITFSAEAFTTNAGTGIGGVTNLSANRWEALPTSGSANLTNTFIRISDATMVSTKKIVQGDAAAGNYSGIIPVTTGAAGPPVTLTTATAILSANYIGYFAYGDLTPCTAPSNPPTVLTFSNLSSSSLTGTFTAANPSPNPASHYLVVRYASGATPTVPVDFTVYTVGATLGTGNVRAVLTSPTVTFNDTGLSSGTTYDYYVYSYQNSACNGPVYLSTHLLGSVSTCAATTGTPGSPTASAVSQTQFTASWAASSTSGVNYILDVATDAGFTTFVSGYNAKNVGTALTDNVTLLTANTTYYVRVRADLAGCFSANSATLSILTECNSITSFPTSEPFATYLPSTCWKEGDLGDLTTGPSVISQTASSWIEDGYINSGTTGAAKINIDATGDNEWLITPYYTIPSAGYRVKYSVGATQWDATTAPTTPWETDDFVQLLVSTSTTNWTVLRTYNNTNVPSHLGQIDFNDISAYNGQTVRFAFRGVEGASNGSADIDFFIDNFAVELTPIPTITSLGTLSGCPGNTLVINGTNLEGATAANVQIGGTPITSITSNSGTVLTVVTGAGTTGTVSVTIGANTATSTDTYTINPKPTASASSNSPICAGQTLNLTGTTDASAGATFAWSGPNTFTSTDQNPTIAGATSAASGAYTFTVTSTAGCTSNPATTIVTVNPTPSSLIITQGSAVGKCASAPAITLNATGGELTGLSQVGTGTTTNATIGYPSPFSNYYGGTKHQILIRASELMALGLPANANITSLTFNVFAVGSSFSGNLNNFQIDMANTATNVLSSSSFVGSLTNVRAASTLSVPTSGLPTNLVIPITPFVWNGTDNLLIQTSYSNANSGTTNDFVQMQNSDPGFVSTNWYRVDGQTAAAVLAASTPSSSGNARPNVGISYTSNTTITWSPSTGLFTDAGGTMAYNGTDNAPTIYAAPSSTQSYIATSTSAAGCTASATINVVIEGTNVTSTADAGPGTLRAALACVVDGGTIMYDQPTTATTILTAPLTIDKNVTIMGLDAANRPEITTSSSGISIDALKTLTLKDVDVKSTAPTQTFTGAGSVSISGLTVGKQ
jgi:hypothetical protein